MADAPPSITVSVKRSWTDWVGSVGILIVAAASLVVSLQTMRETRRMVAAASVPSISFYYSDRDDAGQEKRVILALANRGIGPGEVRHVHVFLDGKRLHSPAELLAACCGVTPEAFRKINVSASSVSETIILPRDDLDMIVVPQSSLEDAFGRLVDAGKRLKVDLCFCSVFDECWSVPARRTRPRPVADCAGDHADDFDNDRPA